MKAATHPLVDMVYLAGVIDGADVFRCVRARVRGKKARLRFEISLRKSFEQEDFLRRLQDALGVGVIVGPFEAWDAKLKRKAPMLEYRIRTKEELKHAIGVLDSCKFTRRKMEYDIWRAGAMKWIKDGPAAAEEYHKKLIEYVEKILK